MTKNISANPIWLRIISGLHDSGIDYVLVGGAALAVHGLPRTTLDIDIFVRAEERTLLKVFEMAKKLRLKSHQSAVLEICSRPDLYRNQWLCFSYKEQEILDVFLEEEKAFEKLFKNSVIKKDKNMSLRVAHLKDIKKLKQKTARPVDIADLELIKEAEKLK
ncbi:MAG: hypothetical protein JW928_08120 [Candidatus Aureabacteria bacterium]|nr:hypothetical protein [Candidatus Auribacterota bacterium]